MSRLEVHHIFPKAQLYKRKHKRPEVNALANFCFLTKNTNLDISDRLPEEYFPEVEMAHPGALASQWIPSDPALWKVETFRDFLEARKSLLADELNRRMEEKSMKVTEVGLISEDDPMLQDGWIIAPVRVSKCRTEAGKSESAKEKPGSPKSDLVDSER
jgi:hypothetical protein